MPLQRHFLNGDWNFAEWFQLQAMGQLPDGVAAPGGIPGSLDAVRDPLGSDAKVLRATLRDTDPQTAGERYRAEVRGDYDVVGQEYWYSFDVLVEEAWKDWFIINQQSPTGSGATYQILTWLWLNNGWLTWGVPSPDLPTTGGSMRELFSWPMPIGRWVRITNHFVWSGTQGLREYFVDGVKVGGQQDIGTAYPTQPPYFKIGIYHDINRTGLDYGQVRAFFKNVRIWNGPATFTDGLGGPALRLPPRLVCPRAGLRV